MVALPLPFFILLSHRLLSRKSGLYKVTQVNGMCCTSTRPVNKQVLAFTLFIRNSSHHVYDDCSTKKQPISAAVILEFSELLNELQNHIETLASYLNM